MLSHCVVSDEVVLDLAGVPAGAYHLGVGLYDAGDLTRPPVTTASGEVVMDGRLILEDEIAIKGGRRPVSESDIE